MTATVRGVSPIFLPDLSLAIDVAGVAAYPDQPVVTETEDRGIVGGSRVQSVALVAEGGAKGEAPAISLRWYDLGSGRIETAAVPGFAIASDGPPTPAAAPRDWRRIGALALAAALALAVASAVLRRALPVLAAWRVERRTARLASEGHAYRALMRVVGARDHAALRPALDLWAARVSGPDPRREAGVGTALLALGAARYGDGGGDEAAAWAALAAALPRARAAGRERAAVARALPPLNPVG